MQPEMKYVVAQMATCTNLLVKGIHEADGPDLEARPMDRANSLLWNAAHIAYARAQVLGLLGESYEIPWGPQFKTGVPADQVTSPPSAAEVEQALRETEAKLAARIGAMDAAALAAPSPKGVPSADGTIGGLLAFFAFHDGYHVGQMAVVRKLLGLSRLIAA